MKLLLVSLFFITSIAQAGLISLSEELTDSIKERRSELSEQQKKQVRKLIKQAINLTKTTSSNPCLLYTSPSPRD